MKLNKTTLATAVAATLALGMSGQASAEIYAGSSLMIKDLLVAFTPDNAGTFVVQNYSFTANTAATLNASSQNTNKDCSTLSNACSNVAPVLDSISNAPTGNWNRTTGANEFVFHGPGSGDTYSNSAAQIGESELATGNLTTMGQISEVEIGGAGKGNANTLVNSSTNLKFTFTTTGNLSFFMSFMADPNMYVYSNTANQIGRLANASISGNIVLIGSNGDEMSWTSNGFKTGLSIIDFDTCAGGLACNELNDTEDLTNSTTLPGAPAVAKGYSDSRTGGGTDMGYQPYGIYITGLSAGTYSLALTATTNARAEQTTVPEPGMLALLGIGLAGMGFVSRRRKAA
jgi:hypothetical protein